MNNKQVVTTTFLMVAFAACIYTQDWPQFLGPERNSTSPQKGMLRTWPETGPEVLWTASIGAGYGGPVVKEGKVYLLDRNDKEKDIMRCFDLLTGKELWSFIYDAPGFIPFSGSRSVPIADGNYVYSCGQNGDLYCFDINTHTPVWKKNIWTDFGGDRIPMFGISQCPLIYGDLLILASQAPEAGVVAYEKLTGNVKWTTPALGTAGNVSPNIIKIDAEDQVVMVTASPRGGNGKVVGMDPLTGKILWEFTDWQCEFPVPCAIDAGINKVLVTGGYELGALMLEIKKQADGIYLAQEVFRTAEFGDHTKPPLLIDGHFYAQYSTNNRRDGLSCMSLDGRIMWKTKREPGFDKGSMILADGLILASDGAKNLYLIEPDSLVFKPLAKAEILKTDSSTEENPMPGRIGGSIQNWAPLALSDSKLLIRDKSRLMCVKVAQ